MSGMQTLNQSSSCISFANACMQQRPFRLIIVDGARQAYILYLEVLADIV